MSRAFENMIREFDELRLLPMEERISRAYSSLPEDDPVWKDIFAIGIALAERGGGVQTCSQYGAGDRIFGS